MNGPGFTTGISKRKTKKSEKNERTIRKIFYLNPRRVSSWVQDNISKINVTRNE